MQYRRGLVIPDEEEEGEENSSEEDDPQDPWDVNLEEDLDEKNLGAKPKLTTSTRKSPKVIAPESPPHRIELGSLPPKAFLNRLKQTTTDLVESADEVERRLVVTRVIQCSALDDDSIAPIFCPIYASLLSALIAHTNLDAQKLGSYIELFQQGSSLRISTLNAIFLGVYLQETDYSQLSLAPTKQTFQCLLETYYLLLPFDSLLTSKLTEQTQDIMLELFDANPGEAIKYYKIFLAWVLGDLNTMSTPHTKQCLKILQHICIHRSNSTQMMALKEFLFQLCNKASTPKKLQSHLTLLEHVFLFDASLRFLEALLSRSNQPSYRVVITEALGNLYHQKPADPQLIHSLTEVAMRDPHEAVRLAALTAYLSLDQVQSLTKQQARIATMKCRDTSAAIRDHCILYLYRRKEQLGPSDTCPLTREEIMTMVKGLLETIRAFPDGVGDAAIESLLPELVRPWALVACTPTIQQLLVVEEGRAEQEHEAPNEEEPQEEGRGPRQEQGGETIATMPPPTPKSPAMMFMEFCSKLYSNKVAPEVFTKFIHRIVNNSSSTE